MGGSDVHLPQLHGKFRASQGSKKKQADRESSSLNGVYRLGLGVGRGWGAGDHNRKQRKAPTRLPDLNYSLLVNFSLNLEGARSGLPCNLVI